MLGKAIHIAEQAATNVSRRQFLGRLGRSAALVAATAGGLLAAGKSAGAGRRLSCSVGSYECADGSTFSLLFDRGRCKKRVHHCRLVSCNRSRC